MLVMPFYPISLQQFIFNQKVDWSLRIRRILIAGVILAVKACHDAKIAHMDIKPDNIMIAENLTAALTDFGVSVADDH